MLRPVWLEKKRAGDTTVGNHFREVKETTHAVKPLAFTLSEVGSQQGFEQRITQPTHCGQQDCREATLVKGGD